MDFDGTDDYVTVPATVISSMIDVTIAARIRWDGGNDWQRILISAKARPGFFLTLAPEARPSVSP